jgi:hypothetical protein
LVWSPEPVKDFGQQPWPNLVKIHREKIVKRKIQAQFQLCFILQIPEFEGIIAILTMRWQYQTTMIYKEFK